MAVDKEDWKSILVKNTPVALIVLGLCLVLMSAAGGIEKLSFTISGTTPRVIVGTMGFVIVVFGGLLIWRRGTGEPTASFSNCGFRILTPETGTQVGEEQVYFSGDYRQKAGEHILLVEQSGNSGRLYFKTKIVLVDGQRWTASCHVGGPVGSDRIFYVAILGKSGSALYEYYHRVNTETGKWVGVPYFTEDIHLSAGVKLRKKQ